MIKSKNKIRDIILPLLSCLFCISWISPTIYEKIEPLVGIIVLVSLILLIMLKKNKIRICDITWICIILVLTLIGMFFNTSSFGGALVLLIFSMIITISKYISFNNNLFIKCSKIYFVFFVFYSIYIPNGFNDNHLGLLYFLLFALGEIWLLVKKKFFFKLIRIMMLCLCIYDIYNSSSRAALIALIVYILLRYFISEYTIFIKLNYYLILLLSTLGSLILVQFYVLFGKII